MTWSTASCLHGPRGPSEHLSAALVAATAQPWHIRLYNGGQLCGAAQLLHEQRWQLQVAISTCSDAQQGRWLSRCVLLEKGEHAQTRLHCSPHGLSVIHVVAGLTCTARLGACVVQGRGWCRQVHPRLLTRVTLYDEGGGAVASLHGTDAPNAAGCYGKALQLPELPSYKATAGRLLLVACGTLRHCTCT